MAFSNNKKHYNLLFIILLLVLFLLIILSSTLGIANITMTKSLKIILSKVPLINNFIDTSNISNTHTLIILNIRLPRILISALIGASLSIVGASFQAIFKNPMADPYVLGISSGSALGASIAIVLGFELTFFSFNIITIFAFLGSLLSTLVVYTIAKTGTKLPTNTLLLAGVSVSFLLSSIISLIMIFNREQMDQIVFWTMGSVASANWTQFITLLPLTIIGSLILFMYAKDLNIMLTGDDTAKSLGIEIYRVKKIVLIASSLLVASCVSVSGIIGFVGLIIPHILRLIVGPDHRILFSFSAVGGAIFMILSDTLARTLIPPTEIPVGAITSIFGAPYFIYLLIKNKKKVF